MPQNYAVYVYIYIYIYVCVCAYIYICHSVHVCVHICIYIYTLTLYVYMYKYKYICICIYIPRVWGYLELQGSAWDFVRPDPPYLANSQAWSSVRVEYPVVILYCMYRSVILQI